MLAALDAWVAASNAYAGCERGLPPQPISITATALIQRVVDWGKAHQQIGDLRRRRKGGGGMSRLAWERAVAGIIQAVSWVSLRFVSDQFGDDDTDAPCDVEWDVHSLIRAVDSTHQIPAEIEPSHVVGTVFPHPSDER